MIGIDINVLLRLLLDDDAAQGAQITQLFDSHVQALGSVRIADVVLAEAMWTLWSVYRQPKAARVRALRALLEQPAYGFEDRAAVEQALDAYAAGRAFTATFDRGLRGVAGAEVL